MRNAKTNRIIITALALSAAVCLTAQAFPFKERFEEKFEKIIALTLDGKVQIKNLSGWIKVETWDRNEVKIAAVKISTASTEEKAKANAALVVIDVQESANAVRIETVYPRTRGFRHDDSNVSVNYQLTIPAKAALKVHETSGDVDVNKAGGFVDINVTSGDTTINQASNAVQVDSTSGDIRVSDVKGGLTIDSTSGNIDARNVLGAVKVDSTSGSVRLENIAEADSVLVESLSGRVAYQGKINPRGRYRFKVHSGNIDVTLPAESAFELDASTFSGDINTEFEIKVQGKLSHKEIRGTINGGGAELTLETFSGNIHLRKGK